MSTTDSKIPAAPSYTPGQDEMEPIREVEESYQRWKVFRKPHERDWFMNHAFFRGQHEVIWSSYDQRLAYPLVPSNRRPRTTNLYQAKVRARNAKFLKNRAKPEVLPATTELKDKLNARLTTKAIDYEWRRAGLEQAYKEVQHISSLSGHGYWWFHWDPTQLGRISIQNPQTGEKEIQEAAIGDIKIEVGSPFEVLVADPSLSNIGDQPAIMRIKLRDVMEVRQRYGSGANGKAGQGQYVEPETTDTEFFMAQRQVATLNPAGYGMGTYQDMTDAVTGQPDKVVVKELFCAPSAQWPKGRYLVVANGVLLRYEKELPYQMWDMRNPYPCIDFPDLTQSGQYWITTVASQLVDPQREYNLNWNRVSRHLAYNTHPKLLAAVQHQLLPGAWKGDPGEVVLYVAQPGIPPPQPILPPAINQDTWKVLEISETQLANVSHIFPEAEGRVGESTSGFQTNLLQEATDAVHAPDIRTHELCVEDAGRKVRRLMKLYFGVPRLLTVAGRNMHAEVFEFSESNIDEAADIIVQAGSALPTYKAAKIQSILELLNAGLFGNPADPETHRKVLPLLEMADLDSAYEDARRDEEDADIENNDFSEGRQVVPPEFFHNHEVHYRVHTNQLKSAATLQWPPPVRMALLAHVILHMKFMNPQSAIMVAQQYGMPELVADLMPQPGGMGGEMAPPGGMEPGMMPPPPAGPPMGGPPPPPTNNPADGSNQFNTASGMGAQGLNGIGPT